MLRLSVPTGVRLDDSSSLDLEIGGAEGNVTLALSRLGRCVAWLGRLPEQHLGEIVLRTLRADGVERRTSAWASTLLSTLPLPARYTSSTTGPTPPLRE
jgi:2-dehydro-3-deoxygluconokinase